MILVEKLQENAALVDKIKNAVTEAPMTAADMKKWLSQQR